MPAARPDIRIVPPDGGTLVKLRTAFARIKSSGATSDGALTCVETEDPPGFVAPDHIHHGATEAFYVLAGSYQFRACEQGTCTVGTFVLVPPNAVRGYTAGPAGGRLLILYLPAGIDEMWQEMEAVAGGRALTDDERDTIGLRYGIEWVRSSERQAQG